MIKIDKEKFGKDRNTVFKKLLKRGIQTSVHYKPLHLFSIFSKTKARDKLNNSNKLFEQILSLPLFTGITKKQQNIVINELANVRK